MLEGSEPGGLSIYLSLVAKSQEAAVEFILKITNADSISHSIAPGFVFDAAIGKWGDGVVARADGAVVVATKPWSSKALDAASEGSPAT